MSRGRRGSGPILVLKFFGVIAIALGVVSALGWYAHADTPTPHTPCGSAVTGGRGPSLVNPKTLEASITSAYALVAPFARLTVTESATPSVVWTAIDRGVGNATLPGDGLASLNLRGRKAWQHADVPAALTSDHVLTDVLHDIGVTAPTSTGGVLSPAESAAVTAACAARTAAASTTAPAASAAAAVPTTAGASATALSSVDASADSAPESTPVPAGLTIAAVLIAFGVWVPLRGLRARVTPVAATVRARATPLMTRPRNREAR